MSEQAPTEIHYLGIDVCKAWLDVHIYPAGIDLRFSNDGKGMKSLLRQLSGQTIKLIAVEATGKWHLNIHRRLAEVGYDVAVVNPYRSRKLADVLGLLAKTDKIDARVLALFAVQIGPKVTPPKPVELEELAELVALRRSNVAE